MFRDFYASISRTPLPLSPPPALPSYLHFLSAENFLFYSTLSRIFCRLARYCNARASMITRRVAQMMLQLFCNQAQEMDRGRGKGTEGVALPGKPVAIVDCPLCPVRFRSLNMCQNTHKQFDFLPGLTTNRVGLPTV